MADLARVKKRKPGMGIKPKDTGAMSPELVEGLKYIPDLKRASTYSADKPIPHGGDSVPTLGQWRIAVKGLTNLRDKKPLSARLGFAEYLHGVDDYYTNVSKTKDYDQKKHLEYILKSKELPDLMGLIPKIAY